MPSGLGPRSEAGEGRKRPERFPINRSPHPSTETGQLQYHRPAWSRGDALTKSSFQNTLTAIRQQIRTQPSARNAS